MEPSQKDSIESRTQELWSLSDGLEFMLFTFRIDLLKIVLQIRLPPDNPPRAVPVGLNYVRLSVWTSVKPAMC